MVELDDIYHAIRNFYSEYVINTKEGKEQKLRERSENIFIAISLGVLGALIFLLLDYKETLQESSFSLGDYDFSIFPLYILLFLINSFL